MSKSVIASLKPYFYYLVGEGIKKTEVRKSEPKADDWNRETYFYMSKDEKSFAKIPKEYQDKYRKHFGKVGLKFVCDRIQEITYTQIYNFGRYKNVCELETRLDFYALDDYLKQKNGFGWHISDLKIYDKPKELSEFRLPCPYGDLPCGVCEYVGVNSTGFVCDNKITKAPQSWGYCEELEK